MTADDPRLVPILMYHSIAEDAHELDLPFTVRPGLFREQIDALRGWGARTISVGEYAGLLREGASPPPRTVVITVDDGYADTADVFAPELRRAGFTATVFVTTSKVDSKVRRSHMISWPQLGELHTEGFEIGAHGHHHVALDILRAADAREEIVTSRRAVEQALGVPVTSFAYPHGYWTAHLAATAQRAGLRCACAAKDSLSHPGDDLFALSRIVVWRATTAAALLDAVDGRSTRVRTARRMLPRAAWRATRWVAAAARERALPSARGSDAVDRDRWSRGDLEAA